MKLWEDTHSNLTFKYPLSARRGRVSIIGPTAARIGQVLKHAIWGFVSQLTVEKGQIASYGVFLYQNNCLSESLQQRAFAAGEVFRERTSAQTQKQPLFYSLQCRHGWKHHLEKGPEYLQQGRPGAEPKQQPVWQRQVVFSPLFLEGNSKVMVGQHPDAASGLQIKPRYVLRIFVSPKF